MRRISRVRHVAPFCLLIISLMSSLVPVSSQTRRGGARQRPTVPGQQRPVTVNQQKTAQQPTTPKPTAAWLLAQPNPLNVSVVASQYSGVSYAIMSASGGDLTTTGPDGTRFTLTVPPNAVPKNVMITMSPVIAIENLPFDGGLVAAVQFIPDDVRFYKAATLLIEPPQPIPLREQTSFASFAYHDDGREFHLYPMESDPSRIAFKLVRLGGYGVARGTKAEQEAVRARIPTDPEDRLFMLMQKVMSLVRERRLLSRSNRVSFDSAFDRGSPRIVRASFGKESMSQQSAAEGESSAAFFKDLDVKLRELYDQVIMPGLKNARPGCTPDEQERLAKVVSDALGWVRQVELLGLTSQDKGSSDEEIQAIDASAEEYRQKVQAIMDAVVKLIKEAFDKTHQCCIQAQRQDPRYPSQLVGMVRQAALLFDGNPANLLGMNYMEKVEQCACAAGGEGWRGTITYSSTASNTSHTSWKKNVYCEFTATGRGFQGREAIADMQFSGMSKTSCPNGKIVTTNRASGVGLKAEVSVVFQPEGTYTVFWDAREPVVGTRVEEHSCATGTGMKTEKWTPGESGQVDGKPNPSLPDVLIGSKEETRDDKSTGKMKLLINWRLTRCKSPKKLFP